MMNVIAKYQYVAIPTDIQQVIEPKMKAFAKHWSSENTVELLKICHLDCKIMPMGGDTLIGHDGKS